MGCGGSTLDHGLLTAEQEEARRAKARAEDAAYNTNPANQFTEADVNQVLYGADSWLRTLPMAQLINNGTIIQLDGQGGGFNPLPLLDADWLHGCMTMDEYTSDTTSIVRAAQMACVIHRLPKNFQYSRWAYPGIDPMMELAKSKAKVRHEGAQAQIDVLNRQYAARGVNVVYRYHAEREEDISQTQEKNEHGDDVNKRLIKTHAKLFLLCKPSSEQPPVYAQAVREQHLQPPNRSIPSAPEPVTSMPMAIPGETMDGSSSAGETIAADVHKSDPYH